MRSLRLGQLLVLFLLASVVTTAGCSGCKRAHDGAAVPCNSVSAADSRSRPAEPPRSFDVPAIESYVATELARRQVVGASLVILREGQIVSNRSFGLASIKTGTLVTQQTEFAIGSVTKQFTCAAVLLLAQEGKLSLDDKVAKYYPALTHAKEITLDDLGSHRSGYPDYYPLDFVDKRMQTPVSADEIIQRYAGGPLDFAPRTHWSYSNTGFALLGRIIEKVSGETLGAFLHKRILTKLGMNNSHFAPPKGTPGLATGYMSHALGSPEPATIEAADWLYAAAGLWTSATDLAKWDLALMEGTLLAPSSLQQLSTPRTIQNGRSTNYSCGLYVVQMNGESVLLHDGSIGGFVSMNGLIPRTRSAVILLTSVEQSRLDDIHQAVLKLVIGTQMETPHVAGPPAQDVARSILRQLQEEALDRSTLSQELSEYYSAERVHNTAPRLRALGEPKSVTISATGERGGMESSVITFSFALRSLRARLMRTKDGKIAEFQLLHH